MNTSRSYHVRAVLSTGGLWQGSVRELPEVTDAHRSLNRLEDRMRRAIEAHRAQQGDTPATAFELEMEFSTGDESFDADLSHARELRHRADELARQARQVAAPLAKRLATAGVSQRDAGTLLSISAALVSTLLKE
ncbi:hypothetical protein [Streptomyces justiciae]|uniref:hypothetical protein n=1 Tax=Streptomyces justiciae TaxID=2780140 RepID=UPI002119A44E|nr:hypothetical protein [Streptomyces justiciae]MCW8383936.1 hypothetical protein [Streptomyces justiciae]